LPTASIPQRRCTRCARIHGKRGVVVLLDLAGHLKDERTLRALREAISVAAKREHTLVLVDQHDEIHP
jgi:hypothetical protein